MPSRSGKSSRSSAYGSRSVSATNEAAADGRRPPPHVCAPVPAAVVVAVVRRERRRGAPRRRPPRGPRPRAGSGAGAVEDQAHDAVQERRLAVGAPRPRRGEERGELTAGRAALLLPAFTALPASTCRSSFARLRLRMTLAAQSA